MRMIMTLNIYVHTPFMLSANFYLFVANEQHIVPSRIRGDFSKRPACIDPRR